MAEVDKSRNVFRKEGDVWKIIYDAMEISLRDTKGLRYLAVLLGNPGQLFHVLKMILEVDGTPLPVDSEILSQMSEERRWAEEGLSISSLREAGDKARVAVRNRITASRRKIQQEHPQLGQHLQNFIKTGFSCSYTPDKPTLWET